MKNLKTLCLFFLIFSLFSNEIYAQQAHQTAYEKKKAELLAQVWILFGQNADAYVSQIVEENDDEAIFKYDDGSKVATVLLGYPEPIILAIGWYAKELKKIQKLKIAVDFQRDKEAKAYREQGKYEKTDEGRVRKNIKTAFEKWNQKGEFEKADDYQVRLKTESISAFESICTKEIKSEIDSKNGSKNNKLQMRIMNLVYDSEKELFKILFTIKFDNEENVKYKFNSEISIPIGQAEEFKKKFKLYKDNEINDDYGIMIGLYDEDCSIDDYDWCFFKNSLGPTLVTLELENYKYKLPVVRTPKIITIFFNELNIDNLYLKGFIFNYSNTKIIDQQIYSTYCGRLDSIFKGFNSQLLQNPYNVDGNVMTTYAKMKTEGNNEDNFNFCLAHIKSSFEEMNNNFEKELERKDEAKYCSIFYSLNPDKKANADKMYLECKCNYPKRENFDIKFIKGNLQPCNCREQEFNNNKALFTSKSEFDSFYDKGDDILQKEIESRILKKEEETAITDIIANTSTIESLDFKDVKLNASSNDLLSGYFQKINNYKDKPYYSKVIEYIIDINRGLKKEWTKNGELFSNKVEYYEAFTSGEYKKTLKEKKK